MYIETALECRFFVRTPEEVPPLGKGADVRTSKPRWSADFLYVHRGPGRRESTHTAGNVTISVQLPAKKAVFDGNQTKTVKLPAVNCRRFGVEAKGRNLHRLPRNQHRLPLNLPRLQPATPEPAPLCPCNLPRLPPATAGTGCVQEVIEAGPSYQNKARITASLILVS